MLDDTFYLYARFKGSDANRHYTNNKNYLIEVRVGRFNKRVKVWNIHGYGNKRYPESELHYENKAQFEQSWKVIRDVSEDVRNGGNGQ